MKTIKAVVLNDNMGPYHFYRLKCTKKFLEATAIQFPEKDHTNFWDNSNFNKDDVKLIDDKARKVISDFNAQFEKIGLPSREILEPIVNELIKSHDTNFKGVGQPLRIALTGSKFGPGIYDIILSLGKEEVQKRLSAKIV